MNPSKAVSGHRRQDSLWEVSVSTDKTANRARRKTNQNKVSQDEIYFYVCLLSSLVIDEAMWDETIEINQLLTNGC